MQTQVSPIPQGYHSITPYLIVKNATAAIEFYKTAFGAVELYRMDAPGNKIAHCELQIGDSRFMMADEFPEMGSQAPTDGSKGFSLMVYVKDVDAVFNQAVGAGAKVIKPLKNEFYGDRSAILADPYGHHWNIASHVEDVSPEELKKRASEMWGHKH